jgi:hypothetical protein
VFYCGYGALRHHTAHDYVQWASEISAAPENNFILFGQPLERLHGDELIGEFRVLTKLMHNHTLSIWEPDLEDLKIENGNSSYQALCKAIYAHTQEQKSPENIAVFVDKNPIYSLYADRIIQIFPEAKFILLTRDYRDNILSRTKYTKGFVSNWMVSFALSWKLYYKKLLQVEASHPSKFIRVRYEDLVEQPEQQIRRITDFIGIGFHNNMLNTQDESLLNRFTQSDQPAEMKQKISEMHSRLNQPINKERVTYWKGKFTRRELIIQELICCKFGEQFGYTGTIYPSRWERVKANVEIGFLGPLFRVALWVYYLPFYHFPWFLKKIYFKRRDGL